MTPTTAALALLIFVAPLLCLPGHYEAANLPQSAWIDVGAWLLLLACLARRAPVARLPLPLVACLAWALVALLTAEQSGPGLALYVHWASCAALFVAARAICAADGAAGTVLAALSGSAALVAAVGLAQYLGGFAAVPQAIPPAATFMNKNVGAGFVALAWPFSLWLWRRGSERQGRLAGVSLGLQALYCFCAFSRSAWLAVGLQLLLLAAWHLRPRLRRVVLPALLLAALGAPFLAQRLPGALGGAARHVTSAWNALKGEPSRDVRVLSIRGRLAMWNNTLVLLRDHPLLGVGLGGVARAYPPYAYARSPDPFFSSAFQLDHVHNDYLQTAVEQGLPGLALLLVLLVSAVRHLRRRLAGADADARALLETAALVLLGACVDAGFSFPLERALPPMLLALAGALTSPLLPVAQPPARSRLLSLAALLAALGLGAFYGRALASDRAVASMFAAQQRGDAANARLAAEQALALTPRAFEPAFVLAGESLAAGQPEVALRCANLALAQRPHDPATLGTRAAVWGALGDLASAEADARRVAELLPREAVAQYEWGLWLERVSRLADARLAFERACRLAPERADYQLKLGVTAYRSGARAQALQAAQAVVAADPRSALGHKLLGVLLLAEPERREEARGHLRQALELDPTLPDAERLRALLGAPAPGP